MINQIFIANMSSDTNKGDLAILENTIFLLKEIYPNSMFVIQNVDYSEEDIMKLRLHRWSRTLVTEYCGSFFPRFFSGTQNKMVAFGAAFKNAWTSFFLVLNAAITRLIKRDSGLMVWGQNKKAWKALLKSDLVVVKGGSYMYSYGGMKDLLFLYRMLLTPFIAMLLGKKVIFWAHSIGPLKGGLHRYWMKMVLKGARCIMVREKLSFNYIKENLGVAGPPLAMVPDLAFIHTKNVSLNGNSLNHTLQKEGIHLQDKNNILVGLTVRDWHFPESDNPNVLRGKYINAIIEVIHYLRDRFNAVVFFVPHCLEDLPFAYMVYEGIKEKTNVHIMQGDYATEEIRGLLAAMNLLIGTRIHSNILALSVGTPVIPIAYETHKGFGIMEMAGVEKSFIFDISDIDLYKLKGRISYLLQKPINAQQRQVLHARITELQSEIRKTTHRYFHQL